MKKLLVFILKLIIKSTFKSIFYIIREKFVLSVLWTFYQEKRKFCTSHETLYKWWDLIANENKEEKKITWENTTANEMFTDYFTTESKVARIGELYSEKYGVPPKRPRPVIEFWKKIPVI